jgi:phospholipid transport system substrate-binding protein
MRREPGGRGLQVPSGRVLLAQRMLAFPTYPMDQSFAAALVLFVSVAGSPAMAPRQVVQTAVDRVIVVLDSHRVRDRAERTERAVDASRAELRRIAGELFDFDEMARRTLSRHWAGRTRAEQAEFVGLFVDLIERSYITRIEGYAGEKIAYVGEALDGGYALVKSKILGPRGRLETTLDYRMHRRNGQWRAYDVLIDGVSFVSTYRREFDRIITGSSYRALREAIRAGRLPLTTAGRKD